MAKTKKTRKKTATQEQQAKQVVKRQPKKADWWLQTKWQLLGLFTFSFLLYANTLTHQYTQDDAIVIYDNMFTQEGIAGIPGILKNDTFYGFFKEAGKAKLVAGGRYRPLTQIMFALEWQLFGKNPFVGHLINVLLYGFLAIMLYKCLTLILIGANKSGQKEKSLRLFAFAVCLIFVAHPIHTEAVANIKGRDEIMALLGSIIALWSSFKYSHTKEKKWLLLVLVSFFCALMSKENAITFLAVVPLAYFFFRRKNLINSFKAVWPFALSTFVFLVIRTAVLGFDFGSESMELMNNPFLKLQGTSWIPFSGPEKLATIIFTLGKYLQLFIWPHPLCHDYYPRAVELMDFSNWQVLVSLALYIAIIGLIAFFWTRDRIISFGLLFFICTLSIVSNLVFPIGTNMSERFLFMPSAGLALVLGRLLFKYLPNEKTALMVSLVIALGLGAKTILRNPVWKDDFTLFTSDVKTNPQSAKLLNAAGGSLSTEASKLEDSTKRTQMLEEAISYLKEAVKIHPTYKNAYLLLGNSHYYLNRFEPAISYYETALKLDPQFNDVKKNLPIVLRDAGRHYGEQKQDLQRSESYLLRSYALNENDPETARLLGIVNGMKGNHQKAITYFEQVVKLNPKAAGGYANLATAYKSLGDEANATINFNKAIEIDPNVLNSQK